ncbi:unnamed protein product [Rotaria sp. Silwood1]|nr:unnamed protein product [Rotaria sp. Silwood1]
MIKKKQLDSEECLNLQFQEKEQIAIGEEQIQHDLDEQHTYRDITTSAILLEEEPPQSYDITINDSIPATNVGDAPAPVAGPGSGGSRRLAQQQAQIDEVVDIMRQNIDKVLERDKNLSHLDDRADKLQTNAAQFEKQAGKLKRKFWLQNMKMMIIMGVVGTIFIIVVGAYIYSKVKAVAPAFPSIDAGGTSNPSVQDELSKVTAASMTTPMEEKVTTKRPRRRRKKTTTATNLAVSTVVSINNNNESNDGQDTSKIVLKRMIRALIH